MGEASARARRVRGGLFGREMVHPRMVADAPLPTALTPVYPSTEGLPQRRCAAPSRRRWIAPTCPTPCRRWRQRYALPLFEPAIPRCTHRRRASRAGAAGTVHPAWRRIKFDELLAQRLSLAAARAARSNAAPPSDAPDGLVARLYETLPFKLTGAAASCGKSPQTWRSRIRSSPVAGRRGRQQDRGRGHRRGQAIAAGAQSGADGAHRNPGRTALPQARRVVAAAGREHRLDDRQPDGQGAARGRRRRGRGAACSWWSARRR